MEIALSFALLMANFVVMGICLFAGLTVTLLTAMLCLEIINRLAKE